MTTTTICSICNSNGITGKGMAYDHVAPHTYRLNGFVAV